MKCSRHTHVIGARAVVVARRRRDRQFPLRTGWRAAQAGKGAATANAGRQAATETLLLHPPAHIILCTPTLGAALVPSAVVAVALCTDAVLDARPRYLTPATPRPIKLIPAPRTPFHDQTFRTTPAPSPLSQHPTKQQRSAIVDTSQPRLAVLWHCFLPSYSIARLTGSSRPPPKPPDAPRLSPLERRSQASDQFSATLAHRRCFPVLMPGPAQQ